MILLIEYNREEGRIVDMKSFDESKRCKAQEACLALELDLHAKGVDHEVVQLEAASEAAIRMTHARYFESLEQLASKLKTHLRLT